NPDPNSFLGASGLCDGKDDDCDPTPIAGAGEEDADGDHFLPCEGDCDDSDATSNPVAAELWDSKDNKGNGKIDGFDGIVCGSINVDKEIPLASIGGFNGGVIAANDQNRRASSRF